jgi:hypothetical protein
VSYPEDHTVCLPPRIGTEQPGDRWECPDCGRRFECIPTPGGDRIWNWLPWWRP